MYRSVANLKISKQTAVRASEAAMLAIQGVASRSSFSRKAINIKRPVTITSLISPILLSDKFPRFWVCWVLAGRCFRCLLRRHTVACRKLRATFGVRFFSHSRVSQTVIKTRVGTMVAISKTVASEPVDAPPPTQP